MALAQMLQTARRSRGLTITALASAAGIHKSTLSRWESGKTLPNAPELRSVMEVLSLSPEERTRLVTFLDAPRAIQLTHADPDTSQLPLSSGELLRALRQRAGRTQEALARACGVSQALVSQWESGETWPDTMVLHTLCRTLGATLKEVEFLTTRHWQELEPLPTTPEALAAALHYLEFHDFSAMRALSYLALAARYNTLLRQGKVRETEAQSIWGIYGYYLQWRHGQHHTALFTVQPALKSIRSSSGQLNRGQQEALATLVHAELSEASPQGLSERISLWNEIYPRLTARRLSWWNRYRALLAEGLGDTAGVVRYSQESIQYANSEVEASQRRLSLCEALVRLGRFAEAQPFLHTVPATETRTVIHTSNALTHAQVYAELGERSHAASFLQQAIVQIERYSFEHLLPTAQTIARKIEQAH